jgi:hypothetical protein
MEQKHQQSLTVQLKAGSLIKNVAEEKRVPGGHPRRACVERSILNSRLRAGTSAMAGRWHLQMVTDKIKESLIPHA